MPVLIDLLYHEIGKRWMGRGEPRSQAADRKDRRLVAPAATEGRFERGEPPAEFLQSSLRDALGSFQPAFEDGQLAPAKAQLQIDRAELLVESGEARRKILQGFRALAARSTAYQRVSRKDPVGIVYNWRGPRAATTAEILAWHEACVKIINQLRENWP
jgi:hypothetical protein